MSEESRERTTYLVGYLLAAILTAAAFLAVSSDRLDVLHALAAVVFAGIIQLFVHVRCFLHIDFSRQKREDLQLILFSGLLLAIMSAGTLWIMTDLAAHMD